MRTELILTQKISDLALEARTGVEKRGKVIRADQRRQRDAVTISYSADLAQGVARAISQGREGARARYLAQLKEQITNTTYVLNEEMAEEIALRILKTII